MAVIVGGTALVATIAILRDAAFGARVSIVAGIVLVGWIVGEVLILTADDELASPDEALYPALGLVMVGLGLVVARRAQSTGMQG